jgi:uncharacterized protein
MTQADHVAAPEPVQSDPVQSNTVQSNTVQLDPAQSNPGQADSEQSAYPATARTTPRRYRERASYDRAAVHAVLDETLVCHVGFVRDGAPVVLPTMLARSGETVYIHGSSGGRFALLDGEPVSVTATLIDGIVFGRSWLHHSAAYRSVVVHGVARVVTDEAEALTAMAAVIEHVAPGRSAESRPPSRKDIAATVIVAVELAEVSLKARGSHVADEPEDLDLDHWAGSVPVRLTAGQAVASPDLRPGIPVPRSVTGFGA